MSNILENEKTIIKTWKGNQYGTILLALPHAITKKYDLENPAHLILELRSDGFFLKKLKV